MEKMMEKPCTEFLSVLASKAAVPGGGGAAALVGAAGVALGNMVGCLTEGKKKYAAVEADIQRLNARAGKQQQIVPYFISSHPGSSVEDMAALAVETRAMDFRPEQVQDFTPTPMTVSTDIYYSGYHPYTLRPVFTAKKPEEKKDQNVFFFWYRPENRARIARLLARFPALRKKLLG